MAIRLREVDGHLVALCAARSVAKPGDVYLDDRQHMALSLKYWADHYDMYGSELPSPPECDDYRLIEQEESNNIGREWWDLEYGEPREPKSLPRRMRPTWRHGYAARQQGRPRRSPYEYDGRAAPRGKRHRTWLAGWDSANWRRRKADRIAEAVRASVAAPTPTTETGR